MYKNCVKNVTENLPNVQGNSSAHKLLTVLQKFDDIGFELADQSILQIQYRQTII